MAKSDSEEAPRRGKNRLTKADRAKKRKKKRRKRASYDEPGTQKVASESKPASGKRQRRSRTASKTTSETPSGVSGSQLTGSDAEPGADGKPSLKQLLKDLRRGDDQTREAAVKSLATLGPKARRAVPYVAKALASDDSEAVRFQCARTLGQLGEHAMRGIPALLRALGEGKKDRTRNSKSVAGAAARAIKRIGAPAVPHLIASLEDESLRRRAGRILGSIPDVDDLKAREAFDELLLKKDKRAALTALTAVSEHEDKAIPILLRATACGDDEVSKQGLLCLRAMGKSAVPPLAKALNDVQPRVRAGAARALGTIAKHASQKAVSRMTHRLVDSAIDDADPLVRSSAVQALSNLTDFEEQVLPHLIAALGDEDAGVGLQAIMGILAVSQDKRATATKIVEVLESSRSKYTRVGCCMVLMHLGQDAREAVDALVETVEEDTAPEVREYANMALQAIRTPSMRLQVIRTASMRLKVVDEEDEPKKGPKKRSKARRKRSGVRRRR